MDVIDVGWRKSSYSGDNGGACVEVGTAGRVVAVRDSKDREGTRLSFAADTWQAFAEDVKVSALRLPEHKLSTGMVIAMHGQPAARWRKLTFSTERTVALAPGRLIAVLSGGTCKSGQHRKW